MAKENVEIVRAGFDAHNRGDLDGLIKLFDPDVELVTLMEGTRRGREAVRDIYKENVSNMTGYRLDPDEITPAGEGRVVAVIIVGGAGRVSQIALGERLAILFTIKAGLIVRQQTFASKQEALEAAGLSE